MQLKALGAQRQSVASVPHAGILELADLCDGGPAIAPESYVTAFKDSFGAPLAPGFMSPSAGPITNRIPFESTYRAFSALAGGTPFSTVAQGVRAVRASLPSLVPAAFVASVKSTLAAWCKSQVVVLLNIFPSHAQRDARRAEVEAMLLAQVPSDAQIRADLAAMGAVDTIGVEAIYAARRLVPNGERIIAAMPVVDVGDLVTSRGFGYGRALAGRLGACVTQDGYATLDAASKAEHDRDPSFDLLAMLDAGRFLDDSNRGLRRMEAEVDRAFLAVPQGAPEPTTIRELVHAIGTDSMRRDKASIFSVFAPGLN